MKTTLLMILFLFALSGCRGATKTQLDTPENIRHVDEEIRWDAVEGATGYIVRIGETDTYNVTLPRFDLRAFDEGTYVIEVRAKHQDVLSRYSDPFSFTIERDHEHPRNLAFDGTTLMWTHPGAESYTVYFRGEEVDTVTEKSLDLAERIALVENVGSSDITVVAHYADGDSAHSQPMVFRLVRFTLDVSATVDPLIVLRQAATPVAFDIDGVDTNIDALHLEDTHLTIDVNLLTAGGVGDITVMINTTTELIKGELTIVDEGKPYVAGDINTYYHGEDVIVHLETFGAVVSVHIDGEHYTLDGHVLTLHADYFEERLALNPDATNAIVQFAFDHEDTLMVNVVNVRFPD